MMKFTNTNLDMQSQNSSKKSFGFLKWIFKTELLIIITLIIIQLIYIVIPLHQKNLIRYKIDKLSYNKIDMPYSENDFINSVQNNQKLTSEDKIFIIENLSKELVDNSKYIDFEVVNKRLNSLLITYADSDRSIRSSYSSYIITENNSLIAGKYNSINNTIYLLSEYPKNDFSIEDNKEILFHELNHLISSSEESFISKKGSILSEVINELFTREYYTGDTGSSSLPYESYMPYAYALCELLSKETIQEYKYSENESVIVDELLKIDNNIDKAYLLIDSINNLDSNNPAVCSNFHDSFNYFYVKKYGTNIDDNITLLTYLSQTKVLNEIEINTLLDYYKINSTSQIKEVLPKSYINTTKFNKTKVNILNSFVEI